MDRNAPWIAIGSVMLIGLIIALFSVLQDGISVTVVLTVGGAGLFLWFVLSIGIGNGYLKDPGRPVSVQVQQVVKQARELTRFKDGTIAGFKVGYLDDNGCFHGADRDAAWKGDHMKGSHICAIDSCNPNYHSLMDHYARVVVSKGHEPVAALVSMYGNVNQLDNGEITCSGAADIVTHCFYYEQENQ